MEVEQVSLKDALQEYFGFDSFKGNQETIIASLLNGEDTFVIKPTGGGKSLCYQLPALISEGTAIIVSPLIALMKNQVDQMRSYSQSDTVAHFLNSSLKRSEIKKVREDLLSSSTKMLYIAPETLTKKENIEFFKELKISFVAVDEAHCISEWGHDFRPEYRRIREMIDLIGGNIPIIALTATATPKVQSDILKNLQMEDPKIYISSFNRDNLYYDVRPKASKESITKEIIKFIKKNSGKSGIIYTLSRKESEEVAKLLAVNGIKSGAYHAGLDAATRSKRQDDFLMEELDVIVATIAFGMGIDKPDVRFVIHFNFPKSLENYYQETGRAGRDGMEGQCIAYYSHKDILKLEKFMRDKPVAEREMGAQLLVETIAYAETAACRRSFVLHYFGEDYKVENCGNCDNCRDPKEKVEAKEQVQKVLQTVIDVEEGFAIQHIVNIMMGVRNQPINSYDHDKLEQFGSGSENGSHYWNSVVRHAHLNNLVERDIESYGLLKMTQKGHDYLKKPFSILVPMNHDYKKLGEAVEEDNAKPGVMDPNLLKMLKDLRRKVAAELGLPPYVIFQDPSLEDMAIQYPITEEELANITGVSKGKAKRYGKKFAKLIDNYVEENEIDRPTDFVVKSVVNKSGLKVYIIQNVDKKISLEDLADTKNMKIGELLNEIESIVASGTKLELSYYIDDMLDDYQQEDLYDYFRSSETDDIEVAYDELKEDGYSREDIQMMKIKFLSEMAN